MRPTIRQLSYLTALEDEGSFSRAALTSHVTQSTLSAGIKELETVFNQPLVDRSRKKITLTPFGQRIADQARHVLADIDRMLAEAQKMDEPLSGPLRLGVIPTIAPYMLPRILPNIQKQFPKLDLQLHEDLSARLVEKLRQNKLDIILMAFPYDTPGLAQQMLFTEEFVLACPENAEFGKSLKISDLENKNLLLLEDGHCLRDHALSACKLQPPQQRKTFSATSLPTLIQMVQHGYGMTLLPEMAVIDATLPDHIQILRFSAPRPTRDIGLAWNSGAPKSEDYRILATTIAKLQKS